MRAAPRSHQSRSRDGRDSREGRDSRDGRDLREGRDSKPRSDSRSERHGDSPRDRRYARPPPRRAKPYEESRKQPDKSKEGQSTFSTPAPQVQKMLSHMENIFAPEQTGGTAEDAEGWALQQVHPAAETRSLVAGVRRIKRAVYPPFRLASKTPAKVRSHKLAGEIGPVDEAAVRDVLSHRTPAAVEAFREAVAGMFPAVLSVVLRELKAARQSASEVAHIALIAGHADCPEPDETQLEEEITRLSTRCELLAEVDTRARAVFALRPAEQLEAESAAYRADSERLEASQEAHVSSSRRLKQEVEEIFARLASALTNYEQ